VSDGEFTDSEIVNIEVGISLPTLPEPFPYDQVSPSQGAVDVDPEDLCFFWPEAISAQEYDLVISQDQSFTSVLIEVNGLTEPQYCLGSPTATRGSRSLDYGQGYFWKVTARNIHGEVTYPVFGFFTQLIEEGEEKVEEETPEPLPDLEYRMISVPLYPEDPDPMAVLGDDLGEYIKSEWRLFRYDSSDGEFHEYPDVPNMTPGIAYWLIAKVGVKIDVEGELVDMENDFIIRIPPGFFQLGCPFPFPVKWSEVKVRKGNVTFPIGDPGNEWISPFLWKYEGGEDYVIAEKLEPWKGYWVENVSDEEVELLIPPRMAVE
jgi:hypothetical protein